MNGYYTKKLSGERLRAMYNAAPPRIQQYLNAEIDHVKGYANAGCAVLELGCGYGRVLKEIAGSCDIAAGIDTSLDSLQLGSRFSGDFPRFCLLQMDATQLAFADNSFDLVLCIQNGISAFHVDQITLVTEAIRVAKPKGSVLFSTYTESFWADRLMWFEEQARDGSIGPIDHDRTGDGKIVCTDGFTASTVSAEDFRDLTVKTGVKATIYEIDGSSLFCEFRKPA